MCGIAGFWDQRPPGPAAAIEAQLRAMTAALRHRGPDDQGHWLSADNTVALGHQRLSIIDLSETGRQPMTSFCGQYHVTYNGELYNYESLRAELSAAGAPFRGSSDTEVLAAGISVWGLAELARRAVGMWALAVWDDAARELTLVRDRLGIKPLYFHLRPARQTVLFGSELKALRQHDAFQAEIDRFAVAQLLRYGYVPGPETIYTSTFKLPPGTALTFRQGQFPGAEAAEPFWRLEDQVCQPRTGDDPAAAQAELRRLLREAVQLRMIADVPLGAFLSGGIDSSLVVAAMHELSSAPVKTFSIGFEESEYDEAPHARAVAKHLGTDHHEHYVTAAEARDVIPSLPAVYDEPFADSSQIPTILVSQMAREQVTVCLSGDGGDELFAGYSRYSLFDARWRKLAWLRPAGRRLTAGALRSAGAVAPAWLGDKLRRRALGFDVHSPGQLYAVHNAHWKNAEQIVIADDDLACRWQSPPCSLAPIEVWMAADAGCYLPDDILTKVDRASMSVGLEARVPLLDHRLVEFAWSLPLSLKIRNGQSKWLLRQMLEESVPPSLFDRPKMGFGVPIDRWLRGPLRDWADDLLSEPRLRRQGLLRPEPIARIWQQHRGGQHDWQYLLWDVLMLQSWLDHHGLGEG